MQHIPTGACVASNPIDDPRPRQPPGRRRAAWRVAAAVAGTFVNTLAYAAGGHHAVDDAAILDPGRCHVESWHQRDRRTGMQLWHVGSACRFAGVEWTLGAMHARFPEARERTLTPQAKWAADTPLPGLALGVAAGVDLEARHDRRNGQFAYLPATYALEATGTLLHANLGRQWVHGQGSHRLWGLAVEQTLAGPVSAVVERFRDAAAGRATQLGLRWDVRADALSIDLGHARGSGGDARRSWTLGVTVEFDGPGARR